MNPDYKTRLAAFLALSNEELERPLWEIASADRTAYMAARSRRTYARRSPDSEFEVPEADQRITEWSPCE